MFNEDIDLPLCELPWYYVGNASWVVERLRTILLLHQRPRYMRCEETHGIKEKKTCNLLANTTNCRQILSPWLSWLSVYCSLKWGVFTHRNITLQHEFYSRISFTKQQVRATGTRTSVVRAFTLIHYYRLWTGSNFDEIYARAFDQSYVVVTGQPSSILILVWPARKSWQWELSRKILIMVSPSVCECYLLSSIYWIFNSFTIIHLTY